MSPIEALDHCRAAGTRISVGVRPGSEGTRRIGCFLRGFVSSWPMNAADYPDAAESGPLCDQVRSTCQYTEYRRSNRLVSGTSVTSFFCPVGRNTCGLSVGLIHEPGSVPAARNVGISRSGTGGVRLTA